MVIYTKKDIPDTYIKVTKNVAVFSKNIMVIIENNIILMWPRVQFFKTGVSA
jgi:hypothetical protein